MKRTRLVWQMGIRPLMEAPNEKHACPTDSEDYLQRTSTRSWPARSGHFLSRTVCTTVWSTPQCEISSMPQSLKAQLCSNVPPTWIIVCIHTMNHAGISWVEFSSSDAPTMRRMECSDDRSPITQNAWKQKKCVGRLEIVGRKTKVWNRVRRVRTLAGHWQLMRT